MTLTELKELGLDYMGLSGCPELDLNNLPIVEIEFTEDGKQWRYVGYLYGCHASLGDNDVYLLLMFDHSLKNDIRMMIWLSTITKITKLTRT